MTKLLQNFLKYINDMSETDDAFLENMKTILTVKRLCAMLGIKRNRYNYLLRTNQLDVEILTLRGKRDVK